ncbi:MAG TPA: AsmA-like C-terminal region-containing protein [Pseudolabrys sp.]
MQATLLGLAIAIILALVAALVGPLLIDWGSHRALFETEASRLIGVNVRVTGAIDARLLPSPRLVLHDIVIGDGADAVRARSLGVEFALGPLMRGEWRAAELRLAGPQVGLGLEKSGRVRAPNLAVAFRPDELSVDRLSVEDGTIVLSDAATGASVTLGRVSFNGEARSLVGPVKGEGAVTINGLLYPYRVTVGRFSDEGGARVHVNVSPVDHPLTIEADGALAFAGGEPHFEGTMSVSRPVGIGSPGAKEATRGLTQPWRLNGKIKASGQSALMQNVEFQYGSEEQGVRLAGVADFKFGAHPRFNGVLSGRQIDLDRAIANPDGTRQPPAAVIRKLAELAAAAFRPPLPFQIGLGIDQVTLGGSSIQNLRGDISSSADGWTLDRLEFRAPGLTQVRLSGRLTVAADGVVFSGPTAIDAADPKTLAGWLEGRSETAQSELRPFSLRGDVTLATDRFAVEQLKVELDRKPASGRLAYTFAVGNRPARLDAEIRAPQFDIDAAFDFGRAVFAGSLIEQPREMVLAADIGRATFVGIEARDVSARVTVDGDGLQIDRLAVADYGGGSFTARGRVETNGHSPHGTLSVDVDAKQTAAIGAFVERFAPKFAAPVKNVMERVGRAKLHATLDITGDEKASVGQLAVAGDLAGVNVDVRSRVSGNWRKRSVADVQLDGTLGAAESGPLIRLLSLDTLAAAHSGPGELKLKMAGPIDGDIAVAMELSADGLSAQVRGQARLTGEKSPTVAATLQVREADVQPLWPTASAGRAVPLPLSMTSHVVIAGGAMTFDNIDATLGGSSIRGKLAIDNASPRRVDGKIEAEAADASAFIAWVIGMPAARAGPARTWASEPFTAGMFDKFTGNVLLILKRTELLPRLPASELHATLRMGKDEIVLTDAAGKLAGGQLSGQMIFHRAEDGLTARARISVTGADAEALLSAASRPAVRGLVNLTAEVEGKGLSPVALIGSLKGSGKIVLTDGQIAGLDPRAFDVAIRAVDQGGAPIESRHVSDLVNKSLESGQLSVKRAEAAVDIASGQLRIDKPTIESRDATLSAAGTVDLTDGSIDARLALSGRSEVAGARPDIFVVLKGPMAEPSRSVDMSALVSWLTLRAVEDQAKRLRTIESTPPQQRARPASKNKQAPALPAPIDIRPAPAPRNAARPPNSVGPQN